MARTPAPSDTPSLGPTLDFLRLLWAVDHALQKQSKRMSATKGVTGPQRFALRVIGRTPGISAGDLAEVLKIHPSTLTGILRRLVQQGFVARRSAAGDERRARLELTTKGRRIADDASQSVEELVGRMLRRTRPTDLAAAARVLRALVEVLEAKD